MGWDTVTPIPTYVKVTNGYEDASASGAEYPLQVMNPHYLRRAHSVFDNIGWLREAWTNPVFISTADAEAAGVSDGDTVLVSSPYGQCVRNACVYAASCPAWWPCLTARGWPWTKRRYRCGRRRQLPDGPRPQRSGRVGLQFRALQD